MPIDLRSDTVTTPTEKMRDAIRNAEVGDDVYRDDPTINHLEKIAAELLGKEAALFVTSGTQGNQVAVLTHTQRGDEIILEEHAHIYYYETGGLSTIAGVQAKTIRGTNGRMPISDIESAIRGNDIHFPRTSLICLENTHAYSGGRVLPLSYMEEVYSLSRKHGIPIHLDGARLFNAAISLNVEPKEIAKYADSVQFCLSKGLSAPMGSILAGSKEFIEKARKWRKMLGGGLRQSGMIGAAGIVALEEMINRLEEDHANAKSLAKGLSQIKGIDIDADSVESNIVMMSFEQIGLDSEEFIKQLKQVDILATSSGPHRIRFVTHREITADDIQKAVLAVKSIVNSIIKE
ncbi:low-specificity L-threonine aldolase [Bacillus sp. S/N-304-OC-R1]|uniref:low-specificity L-threonine aldolase n=1 Tax=Bacillus sp. S/N-304-OC-R1 TaxID=2758034 RepID=UPI001C8D9BA6|nr:low-specificity L-threonine aldolase [Bacillus sp. S/N-304-OC-R1]MBY0121814.1 low-specificity L-threonine aldolase [Bacillus sp. S/N-304-OC-R1]